MPEATHRILLPGVPVSSRRGALGWCSVTLVQVAGRNILFDTGSHGDRAPLLESLRACGLGPADIDLVVASHFHFDHVANAEIFGCDVAVAEAERRYAVEAGYLAANDPFVPRALVPFLAGRLQSLADGDEVAPGLRAVSLPGHTPGTMGLLIEDDGVLLAGDAVKNAWDFVRGEPPPSFFSRTTAPANYARIRAIAGTVVPGHDRPFLVRADGDIAYVSSPEVGLDLYADPSGPPTAVRLLVLRRGADMVELAHRMLVEGEGGIVVELGDAIDPSLNSWVHRLAEAVRRELADDILEVVPTYRSLLVLFDPLRRDRATLEGSIATLLGRIGLERQGARRGRVVSIPVHYGGADGPDLEFVAAHGRLSADEVVSIHASVAYRVYMLGFTPGFPYLGGMSERIAAPRLDSPRTRIPAGSVGIAGAQTGIYPIESPGGWRLIGRTPLRLFDPRATDPFLVAAGDRVRFVPVDEEAAREVERQVEAGTYAPGIEEGDGP